VKYEEERRKEWKSRRKKVVVKRHTAFVTGKHITFFRLWWFLGGARLSFLQKTGRSEAKKER
jgi:hypothetical protein